MTLSNKLVEQNPWWSYGVAGIERDPKLLELKGLPIHWAPPTGLIDLSQDAVYTLRGQRQVGKSTFLKLLARKAMLDGRSSQLILYLDVEAAHARTYSQLVTLIASYLDRSEPAGEQSRRLLLLDEVTAIKNWQTAIRVLADAGRLRGTTLVASGSNCKDIKTGGDRLPRRRGRVLDRDLIMQPLSFRDYLQLIDPALCAGLPVIQEQDAYDARQMHEAAQKAHIHSARVDAHFYRYLKTGGFLVSVAEEIIGNGTIPEHVFADYRSAILGEVARMGRREATLRPIVQLLRNRLGEEFDWRDLAREAHIANHETARDLIEDLELAYVWHIFYRVLDAQAHDVALKSPKRLYPVDPFTWHMLSAWSQGGDSGWATTLANLANSTAMGKLAESVVADHLRRMAGHRTYYYRSRDGEEIDFVTQGGKRYAKIEVKYQNSINTRDHWPLRRHGGGILLSKNTLQLVSAGENERAETYVATIPVSFALALWPAPSVYPVRDS